MTYSDTVNDDKMISSAITVHDKIIIILSQYERKYASDEITFRASGSLLISPPFSPKDYCIYFFFRLFSLNKIPII